MVIKTSYSEVEKAMSTVASVISDKSLTEELKSVIIKVTDGTVKFMAYNGKIISSMLMSDTTVEGAMEDCDLIQLKAKDIIDVLGVFRGLKKTVVKAIEFHISDKEAKLAVIEGVDGGDDEDAADLDTKFNQTSYFRITKSRIKDAVRNELSKLSEDVECVELSRDDLLIYINSLLPTVIKETRESTSYVMFGEEHIYTKLAAHVSIMVNKLNPIFNGFRLTNSALNFFKNFIMAEDTFQFAKTELERGGIRLTLKNSVALATIDCPDMNRAFDIKDFVEMPYNGIIVDKSYLMDVLKRVALNDEAVFFEVVIADGVGTFKIVSKRMTQTVPVNQAKGEGNFSFSMRAEAFNQMIFSHATFFEDDIFIYLEVKGDSNIVMGCSDNVMLWRTKNAGLSQSKGNFAWA